jgi:hypothetical protein
MNFIHAIGGYEVSKNASQQQEQGYNPTYHTQRLLFYQPYQETDQPGVSLCLGYSP